MHQHSLHPEISFSLCKGVEFASHQPEQGSRTRVELCRTRCRHVKAKLLYKEAGEAPAYLLSFLCLFMICLLGVFLGVSWHLCGALALTGLASCFCSSFVWCSGELTPSMGKPPVRTRVATLMACPCTADTNWRHLGRIITFYTSSGCALDVIASSLIFDGSLWDVGLCDFRGRRSGAGHIPRYGHVCCK